MKQINKVDEKLPLRQNLLLGLQHTVIAVLAAIPVPLLIAANTGLSAEQTSFFINAIIFTAGLSTLLASLDLIPKTSPLLPMVMGANFSVVPIASTTINNASSVGSGFQLIAGATMVVGLCSFLLAPFWIKLQRFFPPLVVGTNLMILGVSLLPNTFHWLMGDQAYNLNASMELKPLLLALAIFVFHILISKYLKGLLGNLTILIALIFGMLAAVILGMTDFTPVSEAAWFGLNLPFHYGLPKFDLVTIISFLIAMILGMVEISGTAMGIHDIVSKKMNKEQFKRVLKTLGIGTFISGLFNGVQPTAFVQNVGILDLSKVKSRFAIATSGFMLVLIGLIPKFSSLIAAIPDPVLGGLGFAIFGVIIGSGINMLKQVNFEGNQNMLIVGISIGLCMLPSVYPNFYANFPMIIQNIFGSGILAGSLTAITLNTFFNFKEIKESK